MNLVIVLTLGCVFSMTSMSLFVSEHTSDAHELILLQRLELSSISRTWVSPSQDLNRYVMVPCYEEKYDMLILWREEVLVTSQNSKATLVGNFKVYLS